MSPEENIYAFSLEVGYPVIFTRDVFATSNPSLRNVVCRRESSRRHIVAVAIDSNLTATSPDLIGNLCRYIEEHDDCMSLAASPLVVTGGEACKNDPGEVPRLHRWMLSAGLDRQSILMAIGGGAVLDMVGHAAATFHRGIRLLRLPTTVLAQNDAGIGVKNGINQFGIKNLIGSFSAPFGVISDFNFLSTLEERDRRAGLSEAVKVALIRDRDFFAWLQSEAQALSVFASPQTEIMIQRCAQLHLAQIVNGGDPFEQGSARPLDFGHWAAHKLEAMTGYALRHGEAVAIGIALDACYSSETGLLGRVQADSICALLERLGFSLWHQVLNSPQGQDLLLTGIDEFRAHLGGELSLTMLSGIGSGIEIHSVEQAALKRALATLADRSTT